MATKAPAVSELLFERMDLAAQAGQAIAERGKSRGGLTSMEARELVLMGIDQDMRRHDWAQQLRSEGKHVDLLDYREGEPTTGIRVNALARGRATVAIYGEIGQQFGGVTADDLRLALAEIPSGGEVDLHVHSDGGDVGEGVAMHSLILNRPGRTYGHVDGRACSAATFPLMACIEISMAAGSRMMIHNSSGTVRNAKAEDFERAAELLRETNEAIIGMYIGRWNGSRQSLVDALAAET